jgi:hypothetical protein
MVRIPVNRQESVDMGIDTHEMVLVHRSFRRELGLLPALVLHVLPGDSARRRMIARHGLELLDSIHVHHSGEDDLLWPLLLDRAGPDAELVERMQGQHAGIATMTAQVRDLLNRWRSTADPDTGARLAGAAEKLAAMVSAHLDEEEQRVLPLAAVHVSAAEWARLGEHGARHTPRHLLLRQLGQILEDAGQAERDGFLGNLPAPPRILWKLIGRRRYAGYIQRIRADLSEDSERVGAK